jgi:hypothetical protein
MKPYGIDYVVAAILMGAELDASGDASKLSAQGYRDLIEQIHRTGEWPPQAWSKPDGRPSQGARSVPQVQKRRHNRPLSVVNKNEGEEAYSAASAQVKRAAVRETAKLDHAGVRGKAAAS